MSKETYRDWYSKNKEKAIARSTAWRKKNKDRSNELQRKRLARVRLEVLSWYAKGIPECACCGEKEDQFLSIDHINGRTKEEKKRMGYNLYCYLIKNPIDPNLQVLCHNCNLAKGFYGKCPHTLQTNK